MNNEEVVKQIQSETDPETRAGLLGELYDHNKGLLWRIVQPYTGNKLEPADAMQEAYIGLLEAVERYDESRGAFNTCLSLWVRKVISRYFRDNANLRRIPEYIQDRILEYGRICADYAGKTGGEQPPDGYLRYYLKIDQKQLDDLRAILRGVDLSIYDTIPGADNLTLADTIASETDIEADAIAEVDQERDAVKLWAAVDRLPGVQGTILRKRFQDCETRDAIGRDLGLSRGQVTNQEFLATQRLEHNREVKQIAAELGYSSRDLYCGGLQRWKHTGMSCVESAALRSLERAENSAIYDD